MIQYVCMYVCIVILACVYVQYCSSVVYCVLCTVYCDIVYRYSTVCMKTKLCKKYVMYVTNKYISTLYAIIIYIFYNNSINK